MQGSGQNCIAPSGDVFFKFKYTIIHRREFRRLEKKLTGKVSLFGLLHDLDKLILMLFLNRKLVHRIHRKFSLHHVGNVWGKFNAEQAVIDWESARFSKSDKPLTAREVMEKIYPETKNVIEPVLKKFGL